MIDEKLLSEMAEKYFQEVIKQDFSIPLFGTEPVAPTSITYEEVKNVCIQLRPNVYKVYKFNYELFTSFRENNTFVYKPSVFLFGPCVS